MRPLAGVDPGLEARLARVPEDGARFELIFTVAEALNPAWPVAERAAAALRARGYRASALVCPPRGANPKAGQLACLLEQRSPPRYLVSADADVDLGALALSPLLAPLVLGARRRAGWRRSRGRRPRPGEIESRSPSSDGLFTRSPCSRPSIARASSASSSPSTWRWRVTCRAPWSTPSERTWPWRSRSRSGASARRRSWASLLPGSAGKTWSEVIARQRRWISVIRAQRPLLLLLSYPLFFFPRWLAAPLLIGLAQTELLWAGALALALTMVSVLPGRAVPRIHRGPWWALPLAELTIAIAFAQALSSRRVIWRGHRYRVAPGGRLESVPPAPKRPARDQDPATT